MTNVYEDENAMQDAVAAGEHRAIIGGHWNELGQLQLDFLKARGMQAQHVLLDLGCGSGRLAVKAVPYLGHSKYYGVDLSPSLLSAAREEIGILGLGHKLNRRTFHTTGDFRPSIEMPAFDFIIAQSLFTHMPLAKFEEALDALGRRHLWATTRFYATFFVAPAGADAFRQEPGGIVTNVDRDPYHFTIDAILAATRSRGWTARWIGDWGHPRNQQMCELSPSSELTLGPPPSLPAQY